MFVCRTDSEDTSFELPTASSVHVYQARGTSTVETHQLVKGDSLEILESDPTAVAVEAGSEIVVWAMN